MNTIKYFCDGNTARGYQKKIEGNLSGISTIFGITTLSMKKANEILLKIVKQLDQEEKELIYRADQPDWLAAIILPQKKIAIVHTVLFSDCLLTSELVFVEEPKNNKLFYEEKQNFLFNKKRAYDLYDKALKIHDKWEKPYIEHMDFEKTNKYTKQFIEELHLQPKNKKGIEKHRYLGAATYLGSVDYLDDQTSAVKNRFFIKGRPGSGKSTHLKKIASAALEAGYEVETYHCGFDPNSLDMVIIRELDVCMFDSTAPHEYFPQRDGDLIVDHYELFIDQTVDATYEKELKDIAARYKQAVGDAKQYLIKAKQYLDQMEDLLDSQVDESLLEKFLNEIKLAK